MSAHQDSRISGLKATTYLDSISILTKSYHPTFSLPLHAKIETVHHRAPITETSVTSFKLCITLHQDLT